MASEDLVRDIASSGKLCWSVYMTCKSTPSEYRNAVNELSALYLTLRELEDEAQDSNSILNRHGRGKHANLKSALTNLQPVLRELQSNASAYISLGKSEKRTWDPDGLATQEIFAVRGKLTYHITTIGALRSGISSSALVRIEEILDDIKKDIKNGNRPLTAISAVTGSSRAVQSALGDLEKELVEDGVAAADVERYRDEIIKYMEEQPTIPNLPTMQVRAPVDNERDDNSSSVSGSISQRASMEPRVGLSPTDDISPADAPPSYDSLQARPPLKSPASLSSSQVGDDQAGRTLLDVEQIQHRGAGSCPRWAVKHVFDYFYLSIPFGFPVDRRTPIVFPQGIKKLNCDCTPRPSALMQKCGLIAGFLEGEIIMQIPVEKPTNWVLGMSRHGYLAYFHREWLGELTPTDVSAIEFHPLNRQRTKDLYHDHEHSFPLCPMSIFTIDIPAALGITQSLAMYWRFAYPCCPFEGAGDFQLRMPIDGVVEVTNITGGLPPWFTEHPIPIAISVYYTTDSGKFHAAARLIRQYLDIQIKLEPTGNLEVRISNIDLLSDFPVTSPNQYVKEINTVLAANVDAGGRYPLEAPPMCHSTYRTISTDYVLGLQQKRHFGNHAHRQAVTTRLSRYAKLDISYVQNSPANEDLAGRPYLALPPEEDSIAVVGRKIAGLNFNRMKAVEEEFELVKACVDNFLLYEFNYDVTSRSFVSREVACALVNERPGVTV